MSDSFGRDCVALPGAACLQVRRLQERHQAENEPVVRPRKPAPEEGTQPSRTLEELKSLDQDIERLRKQIEERDKVISALREAAEAKDKKLDQLMTEYTKLQVERVEPECRASMNGDARVQERNLTAFSTSPSPPLCNGELCWTDGFVNKNYHEPVYAQLLNDHTALQKIYNELREKLESKKEDGDARKQETYENGINLIMAEQIRILKEREAQLMSEAEELREQNDLMEFRILELEECRKEEMINEHKHRNEKNIWPERDLEDISDSGVMSLPTSEDLTSDSELGDTIKNYLQTDSAIVPTLFPQIQICNDQSGADFKPKKIVRNAECLQESGIFEDSDVTESADSPTKHTKACQTESILDKAILDIIDSSCDLILSKNKSYLAERQKPAKSDDLTTEISKLSEIQKRIQEKSSESPKSQPQQKHKCPHSNSLHFYEERLRQLEDKLKIYESSGDTKDVLLKKRLEKEIELSHKVKELTEKVSSLEIIKRQIEEERCEFEEAENDSRFQCQRLEVKVQELMEKNSELELEIERQKMMMAGDSNRRKRSKDKTSDVDGSLSMTDATMPAIIAWNMFCLNQTKEELSEHLQSEALLLDEKDPIEYCKAIAYPDTEVFQKLEELISDQKKLRMEYEKAEEEAKQRELDLKRKIEELEGKSMRDREVLDEMTTYLKGLKGQDLTSNSSDSVPSTVDFEMFEEFKRLADNEMKMRRKIDTLERKEQAYLQTLQQADEIWAGMEAEYKKKLAEAEDKVKELEQKKLEETTSKSTAVVQIPSSTTLVEAPSSENNQAKGQVDGLAEAELDAKVKALEEENASLKNLIKFLSDELPLEKSKCEALAIELEVRMEQYVQDKMTIEQLGNDLEERTKNMDKVETALREQISELTEELSVKSKEISNLDVTVSELREEVETLENRVSELVTALHNARLRSHGGSTSSMQATDPRLNDSPGSMSSLCDLPRDSSLLTVKRAKFEGVPEESTDGSELECLTTLTVPDGITDQQTLIERPDDPILTADASVSARTESEMSLGKEHVIREVMYIPEDRQPVTVILSAQIEPGDPVEVFFPALTPCPENVSLQPEPPLTVKVLFGYVNQSVAMDCAAAEEPQTDEGVDVTELSQTNLMLQQTLEKIEEESRLKDLELIELQKTMSEIRKEQQELEAKLMGQQERQVTMDSKATEMEPPTDDSCQSDLQEEVEQEGVEQEEMEQEEVQQEEVHQEQVEEEEEEEEEDDEEEYEESEDGTPEKLITTGGVDDVVEYRPEATMVKHCLDFLQMIRPVLIASAQKIAPSVSNLQVALDNLQNKCRKNTPLFRTMLEGFHENLDIRCCGDVLKRIIPEFAPEANLYEVDELNMYNGRTPEYKLPESDEKKQAPYPRICLPQSALADFSFCSPIIVARKIGPDGLYLKWDTRGLPAFVTGFEIYVNGELHHRVRSATRNQALLSNLDLRLQNTICVYPVSEKGRSRRCSSIVFPDESESKLRS
ncbi:UNVERIFIED_CONTAM: hypothetical protein PYX00_007334 [Menopon gallinae]|uniref:Janus kinase and microtubule-interacting protein C-terminal domain-containing protein n=1 Tax=Menopon gallinae TaxID=328185 RepID=A0AAW2HIV2_9NEOP